jgi:hypothetical protein
MMVAVTVVAPLFGGFLPLRLPPSRNGSMVEKSRAAPRLLLASGAALEVPMTTRLRELIQQLGEAIHESVIESEQIAGVVQDIRQHGFDVLLMLEATIGLNDVAAKGTQEAEAVGQSSAEPPFTQNDLSFLRSLRIAVAGEQVDVSEPDVE